MLRKIVQFIAPCKIRAFAALVKPAAAAAAAPTPAIKKPSYRDILDLHIQERLEGPQTYLDFCRTNMKRLNISHLLHMSRQLHELFSEYYASTPDRERLIFVEAFRMLFKLYFMQDDWTRAAGLLGSLLEVYSSNELRNEGILTEPYLVKIEAHIVESFTHYYERSLDRCLAAFWNMGYYPEKLINTIMKEDEQLMAFTRLTLFNAANTILDMGVMTPTFFKKVCDRTLRLMSSFDINNYLDGLTFFSNVQSADFFKQPGVQLQILPVFCVVSRALLKDIKGNSFHCQFYKSTQH